MAYNGVIFAGTLASINLSAASAFSVLSPLVAQIDFSLFGSVGIGALQENLKSQLSSAIQASVNISVGITNPYIGFSIALGSIALLQAQIAAALSGAVPFVSVEATSQLSAIAALTGSLSFQIAALEALVQGGVAAKAPAVDLLTKLQTALSTGTTFTLSWDGVSLVSVGGSISSDFSTGLISGVNSINPGDTVYGVLLVTKDPAAWAAISATMLVA